MNIKKNKDLEGAVDAKIFLEKILGGPLTFGQCLESIRLCDEISQTKFAKQLKISKAHLCDIEKGRRFVSPERAAKFAKILGYSEHLFIQLALQDELNRTGLHYVIELKAA